MAQNQFKEYPGSKTYTAANGHVMEVEPRYSEVRDEWYYIYAFASHSSDCPCVEYNVEEYAGESE